jgi:CDP-diacylglycerol---serine O-phosphatidyltransferase
MIASERASFSGEVRVPRHFSMLRDFHLADFLTLANGASGTAVIFFAMAHLRRPGPQMVYAAAIFTVAALFFDVMDGRVARWRHSASAMGRELDSLADVISFGVAPAAFGYALGLDGVWDALVLVYFVACGISRLARYNITAESMSADTGKVTYFEGTPIPSSCLIVLVLVILARGGHVGGSFPGGSFELLGWTLHLFTLVYLVSGSLMISKTIHIPKP